MGNVPNFVLEKRFQKSVLNFFWVLVGGKIGGHTWQCSGFVPGSVLGNYSWKAYGMVGTSIGLCGRQAHSLTSSLVNMIIETILFIERSIWTLQVNLNIISSLQSQSIAEIFTTASAFPNNYLGITLIL